MDHWEQYQGERMMALFFYLLALPLPSRGERLPVGAVGGADGALGAPSLKWAPGRRLEGA